MTLQGKALVTKTEELSSIPGAHMVEGENQAPPNDLHLLRVGTWPLCWEMSSMLAILEEIEMERETEEQEGGEVKREGGRDGNREVGRRVGIQPCLHIEAQDLSQTGLPDNFPAGHKMVSGSAFALSICTEDSQEMGKNFAH